MRYSCLIIDRDGDFGTAAARELPGFGFKPYLAQSCEAALGILRQWSFDAALLDADGFGSGYVDVLRRLQPEIRSPLVLLAQPQDEGGQILGLESGATEIVVKPASPRLVAAKLRRLIEIGLRDDSAEAEQVYRIRRKLVELGVDCLHLDTVYGRGYTLTLEPNAAARPELPAPRHPV